MITVIYSEQQRMAESSANQIIKGVLPERNSMNYVKLDMASSTLEELGDELSFLPLGENKKVVVASNFYFLEKDKRSFKGKGKTKKSSKQSDLEKGEFFRFLKDQPEDTDLIILVFSDEIDASDSNPYYVALTNANASIKSITKISDQEWSDRIENFFTKRNIQIERSAVYELRDRIQGDYAAYLNETKKLLAFSNGDKITKADVEALVPRPVEDDTFALSNALIKGDVASALSIYKDFKIGGQEPLTMARSLANQFRFLNQVSYLASRGYGQDEIARTLGAKPGRVMASLRNLDRMSEGTCQKTLEKLYDFEYGILSGKIQDADVAFSLFIATFEL